MTSSRIEKQTTAAPDLATLLALHRIGDGRYRGGDNERNLNDRVFGGQILGQFLAAASAGRESSRVPTMLQMAFLHGPLADQPIDYQSTVLQQGRRFLTCEIRAFQDERYIANGHVSFQVPGTSPVYQRHLRRSVVQPEDLPDVTELDRAWHRRLLHGGFIGLDLHPFIDYRIVEPETRLFPAAPGGEFIYWYRSRDALPAADTVHAATLAYLSDWWLTYVSLAPYMPEAGGGRLYIASLNHTIWFHAPCRADDWLLCIARSPYSGADRALSLAHIFKRDGMLVATIAQESLITERT